MPKLPPLTPTVDYTMDEIQALILAYGAAVREECAKEADNAEAGDGSYDWNAGAATMSERIAAAIRKDE